MIYNNATFKILIKKKKIERETSKGVKSKKIVYEMFSHRKSSRRVPDALLRSSKNQKHNGLSLTSLDFRKIFDVSM